MLLVSSIFSTKCAYNRGPLCGNQAFQETMEEKSLRHEDVKDDAQE
jgi:hypothetical protein